MTIAVKTQTVKAKKAIPMTHKSGRKPMMVEDNPDLTIHDLNCVPTNRPKGSWTNGVKAHSKNGSVSGWFYPPRLRNKGHHTRTGPKPRRTRGIAIQEEE